MDLFHFNMGIFSYIANFYRRREIDRIWNEYDGTSDSDERKSLMEEYHYYRVRIRLASRRSHSIEDPKVKKAVNSLMFLNRSGRHDLMKKLGYYY